ncbi:hypothetical protein KAZ01_00360 [Candidatus Gracilibacteria bacterium]|nr:hypothetical protein [Candidatus Gracilibacteria bacterium]
MQEIFYGWIAVGIVFIIIEFFTTTLYGLSMSIASFIVAIYIYLFKIDSVYDIYTYIIFAFFSIIFVVAFPKLFNPKVEGFKQGLDDQIGKIFKLKKVGENWKTEIDGIDYLIDDNSITDDFESGKKVILKSCKGGLLTVELKR